MIPLRDALAIDQYSADGHPVDVLAVMQNMFLHALEKGVPQHDYSDD
jgi:hypothetical protein